ncbi:uncharacterized protein [Agelaius tricolor]|uniref:uncharacterized protein n=1 Tax=Agelaius tricolor TaxID=9191 RepID=UPI0039F244A5
MEVHGDAEINLKPVEEELHAGVGGCLGGSCCPMGDRGEKGPASKLKQPVLGGLHPMEDKSSLLENIADQERRARTVLTARPAGRTLQFQPQPRDGAASPRTAPRPHRPRPRHGTARPRPGLAPARAGPGSASPSRATPKIRRRGEETRVNNVHSFLWRMSSIWPLLSRGAVRAVPRHSVEDTGTTPPVWARDPRHSSRPGAPERKRSSRVLPMPCGGCRENGEP